MEQSVKHETLITNLQHWLRFEHLNRYIGVAILVGVDPKGENLDMLIGHGHKRFLDREINYYSPLTGIYLLDGVILGLFDFDAPVEAAEKEFEQLAHRFDTYLEYWESGSHPEKTPLLYYLDWADAKKLPLQFDIRRVIAPNAQPISNRERQVEVSPQISGATFDRLRRAIEEFPNRYPDYRSKAPKLDVDVRPWLESSFRSSKREAHVFGAIIAEHYEL
jgi:hypothetical protein